MVMALHYYLMVRLKKKQQVVCGSSSTHIWSHWPWSKAYMHAYGCCIKLNLPDFACTAGGAAVKREFTPFDTKVDVGKKKLGTGGGINDLGWGIQLRQERSWVWIWSSSIREWMHHQLCCWTCHYTGNPNINDTEGAVVVTSVVVKVNNEHISMLSEMK